MFSISRGVMLRWVSAIIGSSTLAVAGSCPELSEDTAKRLANYVHEKYNAPPSVEMHVATSEIVGSTCFRSVRFRSNAGLEFTLVLSPDQRFLARELYDTMIDPAKERKQKETKTHTELTNGSFPRKGSKEAPLTITIFSDFECPFCKREAAIFGEEPVVGGREVQVVFRHFPLPMHPWARAAAESSVCVSKQSNEAFWRVHDFLFTHQEEITAVNLKGEIASALTKESTVDVEAYEACLKDGEGAKRVNEDIEAGRSHDVRATPTLFMNGARREGVVSVEEIRSYIKHLSVDNVN